MAIRTIESMENTSAAHSNDMDLELPFTATTAATSFNTTTAACSATAAPTTPASTTQATPTEVITTTAGTTVPTTTASITFAASWDISTITRDPSAESHVSKTLSYANMNIFCYRLPGWQQQATEIALWVISLQCHEHVNVDIWDFFGIITDTTNTSVTWISNYAEQTPHWMMLQLKR